MSQKKVVSVNAAVALGIICIILVVGLVGAFAYYMPMINDKNNTISSLNSQITARDNTISGLDSQISQLNSNVTNLQNQVSSLNSQMTTMGSTVTSLDSQISQLNSNVTSLQNQVNDLNSTLNLSKTMTWADHQTIYQPAHSHTDLLFSALYAGYVSVTVHYSTSAHTYVQVIYSLEGVDYDNQINVGASGTAVFPILPGWPIIIRVGNTDFYNAATETVTVTYYY